MKTITQRRGRTERAQSTRLLYEIDR